MIISHKYKFIFVKTAKTAGSSVETALTPLLGSEDVWIGAGAHEVNTSTELYYHAKAEQIKRIVPELWEKYLTFAIVRHPCERLISAYYQRTQKNKESWKDFSDFLKHASKGQLVHDHICINDRIAVDRILFFENLLNDLQKLAQELGMPQIKKLPKKKTRIRKDKREWNQIWTREDMDIFKKKYEQEYEFHKKLGYNYAF